MAGASLVNIGVDLTAHATTIAEDQCGWTSLGFAFDWPVWLLRSLNDGYMEQVKPADLIITVMAATPIGLPSQTIS